MDDDFEVLLAHVRQFLLTIANAELPPDLRAKGGASDLVQDTIASALRNRDQFRGATITELRAWLRAILRSELAMLRRRFDTAARDVSREVPVASVAEPSEPSSTTIERLIHEEQAVSLSARVDALPEDQRLVVLLRIGEGLPFAAIGERTGRSEDAARKLFARALDRLRESTTTD